MSKPYEQFDAWKAEQVERVLAMAATPTILPAPEALLPAGEEMAPEDPTAVVDRYLTLLDRSVTLAAAQAAYDTERAALETRGAALAASWAQVHTDHAACVTALETLGLPLDAVLRALWQRGKTTDVAHNPIPPALRQWLQGLAPHEGP